MHSVVARSTYCREVVKRFSECCYQMFCVSCDIMTCDYTINREGLPIDSSDDVC